MQRHGRIVKKLVHCSIQQRLMRAAGLQSAQAPRKCLAQVASFSLAGGVGEFRRRWASTTTEVAPECALSLSQAETPNPDCRRFGLPSSQLSNDRAPSSLALLPPGKTLDFPSRDFGKLSPLVERLFRHDGVTGVFLSDTHITVTKSNASHWDHIGPFVSLAVDDFIRSNCRLLTDLGEVHLARSFDDTAIFPTDDECVQTVKEVLVEHVRPTVQGHGGNVRFVGMELDGTVYVLLEGACRACPSSGLTLKDSIERVLVHWVPEVQVVVSVDFAFALGWWAENAPSSAQSAVAVGDEDDAARADEGDDVVLEVGPPLAANVPSVHIANLANLVRDRLAQREEAERRVPQQV